MTRFALPSLAVLILITPAASAQAPDAQNNSRQLIGTWEGPYQSEAVPPGNLKLVIAREANGEWKVNLTVISDQPPPAGDVKGFTVDRDTITWSQLIADMDCKSTATLAAGLLKGTAECSQGGALVMTATFLLEKKA